MSPSEGGWKVTKDGGGVLGAYANKGGALQAARIVATSNQPSQVKVQLNDGDFHGMDVWRRLFPPSRRANPRPMRDEATSHEGDPR